MSSKSAKYVPPQTEDDLVLAWLRRARESQLAHYEMANVLSRRGRFLGAPVIFVTALVGTSALASVAAEAIPNWSKLLVGLLSVSAAVLSSLQTFFNYPGRAENHKSSAAAFGAVRRKLEHVYATREGGIDSLDVESLRKELDSLAQESLHVPEKIFKKIQESPMYAAAGAADSNQSLDQ